MAHACTRQLQLRDTAYHHGVVFRRTFLTAPTRAKIWDCADCTDMAFKLCPALQWQLSSNVDHCWQSRTSAAWQIMQIMGHAGVGPVHAATFLTTLSPGLGSDVALINRSWEMGVCNEDMSVLIALFLLQRVFAAPILSTENLTLRSDTDTSNCNDRDTWSIFWSCAVTIFACTWVAVHPNIPPPDSKRHWYSGWLWRARITFYAVIGPEFIILWAWHQRGNANETSTKLPGTYFNAYDKSC